MGRMAIWFVHFIVEKSLFEGKVIEKWKNRRSGCEAIPGTRPRKDPFDSTCTEERFS
jgi:hypothetical protein